MDAFETRNNRAGPLLRNKDFGILRWRYISLLLLSHIRQQTTGSRRRPEASQPHSDDNPGSLPSAPDRAMQQERVLSSTTGNTCFEMRIQIKRAMSSFCYNKRF
jgi:hypothetical protein